MSKQQIIVNEIQRVASELTPERISLKIFIGLFLNWSGLIVRRHYRFCTVYSKAGSAKGVRIEGVSFD
jgi:hypothetical protein